MKTDSGTITEIILEKEKVIVSNIVMQINVWTLLQNIIDGLELKGHELKQGNLAVAQNILNNCDKVDKCSLNSMVECLQKKCIFSSSDGNKRGAPDGY